MRERFYVVMDDEFPNYLVIKDRDNPQDGPVCYIEVGLAFWRSLAAVCVHAMARLKGKTTSGAQKDAHAFAGLWNRMYPRLIIPGKK